MPLISVIMSIHNGEKTISRALDSIFAQTVQDFEIVICNDASTDNTQVLLDSYAKKDERIIFIQNENKLGLALSLNRCLQMASGVFVARMDDDDVSLPDRFEKEINFLKENDQYAFVGCNALTFNDKAEGSVLSRPERPTKKDFLKGTPFIHPTVMFRAAPLLEVGGYSIAKYVQRRAQDYDLFMKLFAKNYIGYNIQEPLFKYFNSFETSKKKRTLGNAIDEMRIRFHGFRRMRMPIYSYFYVFVPLYVFAKHILFRR